MTCDVERNLLHPFLELILWEAPTQKIGILWEAPTEKIGILWEAPTEKTGILWEAPANGMEFFGRHQPRK